MYYRRGLEFFNRMINYVSEHWLELLSYTTKTYLNFQYICKHWLGFLFLIVGTVVGIWQLIHKEQVGLSKVKFIGFRKALLLTLFVVFSNLFGLIDIFGFSPTIVGLLAIQMMFIAIIRLWYITFADPKLGIRTKILSSTLVILCIIIYMASFLYGIKLNKDWHERRAKRRSQKIERIQNWEERMEKRLIEERR